MAHDMVDGCRRTQPVTSGIAPHLVMMNHPTKARRRSWRTRLAKAAAAILVAAGLSMPVASETVLVISADVGSGSGPWPTEISSVLTGASHTVTHWTVSSQGTPALTDLQAVDAVVWSQGERWNALSVDAMAVLLDYVKAGGRLILEGADVGYDAAANLPFQRGVLRARYESDDTNSGDFEVVDPAHPVTAGLPATFSAQSVPSYPDGLTADFGGHALVDYVGLDLTAVVSHPRTVLFGFPLHRFQVLHRAQLLLNALDFVLQDVHDLAVTEIDPYGAGQVTLTVRNWGAFTEDSFLSLWAGTDPAALALVNTVPVHLDALEGQDYSFTPPPGTTWYRAEMTSLANEVNTDNNVLLQHARFVHPDHPRLFFTDNDVPFLQTRVQTTHAAQWQVLTGYLNQYLNYDYTTAPESWYHMDLPAFAFGYAISGYAPYRDKTLELMNQVCAWSIPNDDMPNRERLLILALGLDWTYDGLTPAERAPIVQRIDDYLVWVANFFSGSSNWFQGHERWGMITLCMGALATIHDSPLAPDYLELSSAPILDHVVPIWEYFGADDGGHYYGTDYEGIVLRDMVYFFEAWRTATGEDVAAGSDFWPKCIDYRLAITHPDHSQARIDDCWAARVAGYEKAVANWVASKYGVGTAQWFGDEIAAHDPTGNGIERWDQWWEVLWWDPQVTATAPTWTAKHFTGIGQVSMRNDWSDDATVLNFFCGDYGGGHDHYHQNSFTLHHRGDLALHNGGYDSFGSDHHDGYYQRTISSNTITVFDPLEDFAGEVNDGGQRFIRREFGGPVNLEQYEANPAQYECGDVLRFHTEADFDYVMGDATAAYRSSKVDNFTRQLVFLKPGHVVLYDRLTVVDPAWEVNWHLHALNPPLLNGTKATILTADGTMTCETLLPVDAVHLSQPVYDVHGVNVPPASTPGYALGDGRLDVWSPGGGTHRRYLHLLSIGDGLVPPTTTARAVRSRDGRAQGLCFDDWTIWFATVESKDGTYLEGFTIQGEDLPLHHLVFDVDPSATYEVRVDGALLDRRCMAAGGFVRFDRIVVADEMLEIRVHGGEPPPTPWSRR